MGVKRPEKCLIVSRYQQNSGGRDEYAVEKRRTPDAEKGLWRRM